MSENNQPSHRQTPSGDSIPEASIAGTQTKVFETQTLEPVITFTLFSLLPTELRHMVWKHALPPTDRVLSVGLTSLVREDVWHWELSALRCFEGSCPNTIDTTMLAICKESRTEYREANPKFLPERGGGKFYYNPSATVVQIVPCIYAATWNLFWSAWKPLLVHAPWFADIELLAIHVTEAAEMGIGVSLKSLQSKVFVNAKEIIWIENLCFEQTCLGLWPELCAKTTAALDRYRERRELSDSRFIYFDTRLDSFMDM